MMKKYFSKKMIITIAILLVILISFVYGNTIIGVSETMDDKKGDILAVIEFLGENINFLLWPLLKLAAVSITNDLVYGTIFGLDKYLWYIWNIMKNFANFAIGFVFFASILAFLFSFKQNILHPKKIIPKLVITALLVNISWFLIMVLIDISTILVYTFGSLPLNFFKDNKEENKGVLLVNYTVEINKDSPTSSGDNKLFVYFTDKEKNVYLPCLFSGDKIYYPNKDGNSIYYKGISKETIKIDGKEIKPQKDYCVISNFYGMGYILFNPGDGVSIGSKEFEKKLKEGIKLTNERGVKISNLINTDYSLGSMYYLFSSFVSLSESFLANVEKNVSEGKVSNTKGVTTSSIYTVLKALFILFLIVPLFLFVLVLIIRVFYIWIIIAISPILAFLWGIGFSLKGFVEKFSLTNVLTLIFLPAVAMFALSVGILFLNGVETTFYKIFVEETKVNNDLPLHKLNCESDNQVGIQVPGTNLGLCIKAKDYISTGIDITLNLFWYIIFNFLAFMILWAILMASLKTSKITAGFVSSVEGFVKEVAKSVPLPTPLGKLSIGSAQTAWKHIYSQPDTMIGKQFTDSKLGQLFYKITDSNKELITQSVNNLVSQSNTEPIGSENLKQKLFDFIMGAKWGKYGNIFDYEDQILQVINKAFGKKFDNLKEALTDKAVLEYFLSKGEDISKFVEKLFSDDYKRKNKDKYIEVISDIYRQIENILLNNNAKYLKNNVYKYGNKLYKFVKDTKYQVVGVDVVKIDDSSKANLEKLLKFVNENDLDLQEIIANYEAKQYNFDNKFYKIDKIGSNYVSSEI